MVSVVLWQTCVDQRRRLPFLLCAVAEYTRLNLLSRQSRLGTRAEGNEKLGDCKGARVCPHCAVCLVSASSDAQSVGSGDLVPFEKREEQHPRSWGSSSSTHCEGIALEHMATRIDEHTGEESAHTPNARPFSVCDFLAELACD